MVFLDTAIMKGVRWVLGQLAAAVESEMNDEAPLKEELLAAQVKVELGEMTEEEFRLLEEDVLSRLREIREYRKGGASAPQVITAEDLKAGVIEAEAYSPEEAPPPKPRRAGKPRGSRRKGRSGSR